MKKKLLALMFLIVLLVIVFSQVLPLRKDNGSDSAKIVEPTKNKLQINKSSGEVEGEAFSNHYGVVQVKIIVDNGKLTDIKTLIAPAGESSPITEMSLPVLRSDILASQSLEVDLVSGATETSASYIQSVRSAVEAFNKGK